MDIKAVDQDGAVYNIEMQLVVSPWMMQRLVFYGCEIFADQLREGDGYEKLRPAYTICLIQGQLWPGDQQVHHAFKFTDAQSGRVLDGTLEIHTLEMGKYNLREADLATATQLERWLYWFLNAAQYEPEELLELFPEAAIQQVSQVLTQIKGKTEGKLMYDAQEKARLDREWQLSSKFLEGKLEGEIKGKIEGEIKLIRTLQEILRLPPSPDAELQTLTLVELNERVEELRRKLLQR